MRSYSETNVFSDSARWLLARAQEIVSALPDPAPGRDLLRCHEVARVVARRLVARARDLEVVDGKFGPVDHSWIEIVDPPRRLILDVYAVGSLPQVQLHEATALLPHWRTYSRGDERDDVREDVIQELDAALGAVVGWRCACGALTSRLAEIGQHTLPVCDLCAERVPLDDPRRRAGPGRLLTGREHAELLREMDDGY